MAQTHQPYHRGNLEAELLRHACDIISLSGVDALSLRELGRKANVSRAAPYHYFPTKADLLQRIGAIGFARLAASIESAAGDEADPAKRVVAGFRGYLAFAHSEPAIFELMFANRLPRDRSTPAPGRSDLAFSSDDARRAFGILVEAVAALPQLAGRDAAERLAFTNVVWAFAHGVAVLDIGDNLKGVGAQELLERGLEALIHWNAG